MSSSSQAIRLRPEPLRSLAFGDINSDYTSVGSPLINASRLLHLQNQTDSDIFWSLDGINDHGFLAASGGFILMDLSANQTFNQGAFISALTTIYIKTDGSPSSGGVYITTLYGSTN